jgi:feruloyl esterase
MNLNLMLCGILLALGGAAPAIAATCESLSSLALPHTTVTLAESLAAGGFSLPAGRSGASPALPAFCRVAATIRPSSDSDIKIEVWLPSAGWNGNLEANGNGGWTGSINPATLAAGMLRGYATAMTDLGHEGSSASFALGHPEKVIDFGYRAAHEMTIAAKAIVASYYGRAPKLSYWSGCSAGGRSALMEAQRFPADFDGIIAGAPGLDWTGRAIQSVWIAQAAHKDEASYIPPNKYPLIHNAVLQACDARDGLKDGVLEDPTRCDFDPKELQCKGSDESACLTAPQVETARAVYATVMNQRTKQPVFRGFERGSEAGWATMAGPQPFGIGADLFKYMVFNDPNWDYKAFDFDTDVVRTAEVEKGLLNATDPNLKAFIGRGGKLIQYHGWSDPQIAPRNSVSYYQNVLEEMGGTSKVQGSYRLFMVPGMGHCRGGDGTSEFDVLGALEQWVEKGTAPDQILASRVRDGKKDRTRPLCPYPEVATYKGTGSTDAAASFVCKKP